MSDTVIRVENLSKQYFLGNNGNSEGLRHAIHDAATAPLRWLKNRSANREPALVSNGTADKNEKSPKDFWALKNVSFEIKQGEVVGVIGRNGAGKSTLLKILSRITEPTKGRVEITGRVASLLEVGTGFHPELTGRENVFLNGAILGMGRGEIRKKFDESVAFAEVEKFLDTPVKRYSSGMYVRLAFAVAAHLEPEILIVDEVLAVGDMQFQKKCLGKMKDVAGHGRTVLFVSHNLSSIRELCHSAVLLKSGEVEVTGACRDVIAVYMGENSQPEPLRVPRPSAELIEQAYITSTTIETPDGRPALTFPVGQPWQCRVRFTAATPQENLVLGLGIVSAFGASVQTVWSEARSVGPGEYEIMFEQDRVVLESGTYSILIGLDKGGKILQQFEAARIEFETKSKPGTGHYQKTSGVGFVLNSMRVNWKRVGAADRQALDCVN